MAKEVLELEIKSNTKAVTKETKDLPVDQQEKRSTFKVGSIQPWDDGEVLTLEELDDDVPF